MDSGLAGMTILGCAAVRLRHDHRVAIMGTGMRIAVLCCAIILLWSADPAQAASAAAGQAVFNRCRICHTIEPGGRNIVGPNLHGIFGRKAGSLPNFAYSPALRESGVVWDDDTLTKYLRDPKEFIPGDRMAFPGIKDEGQLADLIAYLREAAK
jgi:cytochrome c